MKQLSNDLYKDEIIKTENMVRGIFYNSFNKAYNGSKNNDKFEDELEIKISKWKKSLRAYIEDNNPYKDNKVEFDISTKNLNNKKNKITREDIINDLNNFSNIANKNDIDFWINKLNNYDDLNIIKKNIILLWERIYNKKNNEWLVNTVKNKREQFIIDIELWINLLKKLKYMSNILRIKVGVLWDFRVGELNEEDISLLKRWIDFIEEYKDIEIICNNMGISIDIDKAIKNIEFKDTYSYTNKKITSKDEIVGVYFSNDIENIVPEELSLLCSKDSEKLFKLKYLENRLLCFDKSTYTFNEIDKSRVLAGYKKGKGDMIICIDTSGSMKGINEYIAKAIMFKMVMQALSQSRNVYLINFSTEIYTYKFTNTSGVEDLIKFLKLSYYGGSDIYKALFEANRVVNASDFNKADILVLSDFIMDDMPENLIKLCNKQKEKGNKFFAVSIGKFPFGYSYRRVFNKHWIFDIDNGIKSIY